MIDKESFKHLIDERGFLTDEGARYVSERFGKEVDDLLHIAYTPNQAKIIGSVLKNVIGDKVANRSIELNKRK